jgi:hypothetical protein
VIWYWYGFSNFHCVTAVRSQRPRPTNERGERVTPSDLEGYRLLYQFRGPGCFCSMQRKQFTEAAMYLALRGRFRGEYVASCARKRCKYFSE